MLRRGEIGAVPARRGGDIHQVSAPPRMAESEQMPELVQDAVHPPVREVLLLEREPHPSADDLLPGVVEGDARAQSAAIRRFKDTMVPLVLT